jgi:glycosyltransferase involved in cell wall biosynthesis
MKKVLILAYDFPPYVSVGGLRPYNWYKHLKEFGVEPIVVTRQWGNVHGNHLDYISAGESEESIIENTEFGIIIRTPYKPNFANRLMLKYGDEKYRILRKSFSAFYELAQFIFPIGPKAALYREAREFLKNNEVDVILATGDPFVLFSFASKLSKEYGIPWIADYRDPWSHNEDHGKTFIQKKWNSYFEKKIVSTSSYIQTVSKFVYSKIEVLIPNKPHSIAPNGYDTGCIDTIKGVQQNDKELSISFVGTIYKWHPIESFLRVANTFVTENPQAKIIFKFYGTNFTNELDRFVNEEFPRLRDHIVVTSKMQNKELLEKLASDNVMLLFNYYSFMGTKIFDYLGIRRKIILCYENDPEANLLKQKYYHIDESGNESKQLQAELLHETNAGIIVKDAVHLKEVLKELYAEFQETGKIACDSIGIEKYSRKIQVERLAGIIKGMATL